MQSSVDSIGMFVGTLIQNTSYDMTNELKVSLEENGKTITCDNAVPGNIYTGSDTFDNQTYYIAKNKDDLISNLNALGGGEGQYNPQNICTTFVTDISSVFANKGDINPNITSWDVRNVKKMNNLFDGLINFNLILD